MWLDEVSAARALLGLSVHISGQTAPARAASRRGSAETDSDVDMDQPSVPAGNGNDTPAADNDNLSEVRRGAFVWVLTEIELKDAL